MAIGLGFGLVILLFLTGAPIWSALSIGASILLLFECGIPENLIPITFFGSVDTFTLMACPFFILAGNIMAYGGSSPYIFNVMNSFAGRIRGGIPIATILTAMVYAAITGSTAATLAGISAICLPNLRKAGYSDKFSSGLMACSATLGQLIPPSVIMIVYGSITQENAGTLFLAGIIPGFICASAIGIVAYFRSPKVSLDNFDPATFSWENRRRSLIQGTPALLMPVLVLGGIYTGVVTPTEAGALACVYGLFVSIFVYRKMGKENLLQTFGDSAYSNTMVFNLCAASLVFALPLTFLHIPQTVARIVGEAGLTGTPLILAITAVYLVMGCFLDPLPILYLVLPIVLPALKAGGVNLVHFNIVTVIAMQIGQVTPPFGISLYMSSKLVGVPITDVVKEALPYLGAMVITLLLIIFFPSLSLALV